MLAFIAGLFRPFQPANGLRRRIVTTTTTTTDSTSRRLLTSSSSASASGDRASSSSSSSTAADLSSAAAGGKPAVGKLGVVITGGTKGVGRALASGFLKVHDTVVINSRSEIHVRDALLFLRTLHPDAELYGHVGDVRQHTDVERLLTFAHETLGRIDAFICNAGTVGGRRGGIVEQDADDLKTVVDTNLLGPMLCAKEAIRVATTLQSGEKEDDDENMHVFIMDGAGTIGNATPDSIAYGATKRCIPQLIKSLNKQKGVTNVRFHQLSPGMVLTDLLLRDNPTPTVKRIFNMLAEEPETVAVDLVPRIRSVVLGDKRNQYVAFLTIPKAVYRLVTGFLLGFRKNLFFDEATGNRVDTSGQYNDNGVRIK